MKAEQLIKKVEKIIKKHGNIDVVVDVDENGFYDVENVELKELGDYEAELVVNIKSSNEC